MAKTKTLTVNGKRGLDRIRRPGDMPLLYVLRDNLEPSRPALRLRARPVRRLHCPHRRRGGPLLRHAAVGGGRRSRTW